MRYKIIITMIQVGPGGPHNRNLLSSALKGLHFFVSTLVSLFSTYLIGLLQDWVSFSSMV